MSETAKKKEIIKKWTYCLRFSAQSSGATYAKKSNSYTYTMNFAEIKCIHQSQWMSLTSNMTNERQYNYWQHET